MALPQTLGGIFMPDGSAPADTVRVFAALCWARAYLWREGHIADIPGAVDALESWAAHNGLIDELGQDEVQRLIAEAFNG
jgi:hypothetical protein